MQPETDPIVRLDRDERLLAERHKPSRVTSQSRAQSRAVSLDDPSLQRVPDRGERRVESPRADFNPFNEAAEDADTIEVSHTEPLARASQTPGSPDSASAADGLDMPAPREPELPLRAQSSTTVDGVTWSPSVLVRDPMATMLLDASGLLLADAGSAALGSEISGAASTSAAAGAATASATGGFLSMVWPAVLGVGSLAVLASSKHSSGSSPATPDTTTQPPTTPVTPQAVSYTISGGLMAGPILKPLKVTAYDAQGRELGTAMTVESSTGVIGFGNYTITFTDPSFTGGAVLLRVTDTDTTSDVKDKDFLDEATHASANITDLRAVVYVAPPAETTGKSSLSASVTAYITPLADITTNSLGSLNQPNRVWSLWAVFDNTVGGLQVSQTAAVTYELDTTAPDLPAASDMGLLNDTSGGQNTTRDAALKSYSYDASSVQLQYKIIKDGKTIQDYTDAGANLTPQLTADGKYSVLARLVDKAGNYKSVTFPSTPGTGVGYVNFVLDTTAPLALAKPTLLVNTTNGLPLNTADNITSNFLLKDPNPATETNARLQYTVQRSGSASDKVVWYASYLDAMGAANGLTGDALSSWETLASGTTAQVQAAAAQLKEGLYTVTRRQVDVAGRGHSTCPRPCLASTRTVCKSKSATDHGVTVGQGFERAIHGSDQGLRCGVGDERSMDHRPASKRLVCRLARQNRLRPACRPARQGR